MGWIPYSRKRDKLAPHTRKVGPVRKARYAIEYLGFRMLACLIEMLSVRQTARLARSFAWLMTDVLPRRWTRYEIARENIARAFNGPNGKTTLSEQQIEDMIRGMWGHLFRVVVESIQWPRRLRLVNCREAIVFRDRKPLVKALCSGRRVIVLAGHFGNWEVSLATFGQFGFPMGVVARHLDNPYLHRWFVRTREATGHRLYLKQGGFDGMIDAIGAGGNLILLADQDAGGRGVFVDFFGRPASTFKSIALMAIEYDALIAVGYGLRLADDDSARWARFEIGCETIIDPREIKAKDEVREITRLYTAALEQAIRRAPEQYFWVHRRWKSEPRKGRNRAAALTDDAPPSELRKAG
jgi:KDO2-lipid IV(A) lauroyltransferase